MGLRALQRDFATWLVAEDHQAAERLPLAATAGLSVYLNNYRGQLMGCLTGSYPNTLAWIGESAFLAAAADHVESVPPHSWTLDDYAERFPGTLARRYPADPEVADLARLELALAEAFVAPDADPLIPSDIAQIDWTTARLRLVPSATFLDLTTNAAPIWAAIDRSEEPPATNILARPARLLIWRQDFVCCFLELDENERLLSPLVAGGIGFEAMCERMVSRHGSDEGVRLAGELLARWSAAGMLLRPTS